jgi:hypothetical protein
MTLLNAIFDLLTRLSHAPPVEQGLVVVADPMYQALFFAWIKSPITTKEMW